MSELEIMTKKETISSLEIAEITGKQHSHVMRDIRSLLEQGVNESNFGLKLRINDLGHGRKREDPYYSLTPKGCLILASGYDPLLREKIIDRLEMLEKQNASKVPQSFAEALMLAAKQQEKIEQQQKELENKNGEIVQLSSSITEMQPKVTYVDMVLQCKETVTTTQIAQDYGMSAKAFNVLLRNFGIQHKVGGQWILYSKFLPCGYVQSETIDIVHTNGTKGVVMHTKWTQKGRLFIYEQLKSKNVLPLIEK